METVLKVSLFGIAGFNDGTMEDISSTALVTVQAYRNIAEDASKRGTLIQVFSDILHVWMVLLNLQFIRMKLAYNS